MMRHLQRPVRVSLVVGAAMSMVLGQASPAWAWGHHGHRIVAKFASTRLNSKARVAIQRLLDDGEDLADASTWPDEHKTPSDAPWHYVNVPLKEAGYQDKFCDAHKGCVVTKIGEVQKILADPGADSMDRRRALRFLVHLVGDIHQPLHVADNDDRGGNTLHLQFFRKGTNLHSIWDEGLLMHDPANERDDLGKSVDEGAWVVRLHQFTTEVKASEWLKVNKSSDWANESLQKAKEAYRDPETGDTIKAGARLADEYEDLGLKIVEERLAQAGVRLANLLNDTLGK
jgi:nuclease S1